MKHKVLINLVTDIDNKDVSFDVFGDTKVIGTLLVSKGRVEWRPKHKSKSSVHSFTWLEFAALVEGGSLSEKAVYDGKNNSNPVGGPGIRLGTVQVSPIKGGARNGVQLGSGAGYVDVGLRLLGGGTAKKVILPAGLSMVPSSSEFQNGVLVQDVQVDVPANKEEQFLLKMYCANKSRKTPDESVLFSIGPILSSPGLNELIELLRGKAIPTASAGMVQDAVWEVTEGRVLTGESKSAIHKLAAASRQPESGPSKPKPRTAIF